MELAGCTAQPDESWTRLCTLRGTDSLSFVMPSGRCSDPRDTTGTSHKVYGGRQRPSRRRNSRRDVPRSGHWRARCRGGLATADPDERAESLRYHRPVQPSDVTRARSFPNFEVGWGPSGRPLSGESPSHPPCRFEKFATNSGAPLLARCPLFFRRGPPCQAPCTAREGRWKARPLPCPKVAEHGRRAGHDGRVRFLRHPSLLHLTLHVLAVRPPIGATNQSAIASQRPSCCIRG